MPREPLQLYRPARVSDGEGGFTEALPTTPAIIFGSTEIFKGELVIEDVDIHEDVKIGDQIVVVSED